MIIPKTFLEKLENFAYNDSTLVDQNSNYHGFFVFLKLLCSQQNAEFHRLISSKCLDFYNLKKAYNTQ